MLTDEQINQMTDAEVEEYIESLAIVDAGEATSWIEQAPIHQPVEGED